MARGSCSQCSSYRATAIKRYKQFISEGKNQPSMWEQCRNQIFIGNEDCIEKIQSEIDKDADISEIPLRGTGDIPYEEEPRHSY